MSTHPPPPAGPDSLSAPSAHFVSVCVCLPSFSGVSGVTRCEVCQDFVPSVAEWHSVAWCPLMHSRALGGCHVPAIVGCAAVRVHVHAFVEHELLTCAF